MNYWIFVATEYSDYHKGSIDKTLNDLIRDNNWKFGRRTLNRNNLKEGDLIIIYQSGMNGKRFIVSAILYSEFIINSIELYGHVKVRNINIFDKPILIKQIINKLNFIKNKKYWGIYSQNGIIKINQNDYEYIINIKNKQSNKKSILKKIHPK